MLCSDKLEPALDEPDFSFAFHGVMPPQMSVREGIEADDSGSLAGSVQSFYHPVADGFTMGRVHPAGVLASAPAGMLREKRNMNAKREDTRRLMAGPPDQFS